MFETRVRETDGQAERESKRERVAGKDKVTKRSKFNYVYPNNFN